LIYGGAIVLDLNSRSKNQETSRACLYFYCSNNSLRIVGMRKISMHTF
jgi:hypothetical protein